MLYFPTKFPKGRVPDREYFWNVLHTFQEEYVQQLIKHAHEQRNSPAIQARAIETIEISDQWWDRLNELPFISRKCPWTSLTAAFVMSVRRTQRQDHPLAQSKLQTNSSGAQTPQD